MSSSSAPKYVPLSMVCSPWWPKDLPIEVAVRNCTFQIPFWKPSKCHFSETSLSNLCFQIDKISLSCCFSLNHPRNWMVIFNISSKRCLVSVDFLWFLLVDLWGWRKPSKDARMQQPIPFRRWSRLFRKSRGVQALPCRPLPW